MLTAQSITVIGAGIGGLASAAALARGGADVRVLERAKSISEVGAGVQITPNGVAVLDALGLGEHLRDVGDQPGCIVLRDYRRGTQVARLDLRGSGAGRPYLLVHRADLIDVLAEGARAAGADISFNKAVTGVAETSDGVSLTLDGGRTEAADMLVGADGLHSVLRPVLNGPQKPKFTGQVAWRAIVEGAHGSEVTVFMGPGRHLVIYPIRGGSVTNIVAVEERSTWTEEGWHQWGDATDLRRAFASFCPLVRGLLEHVSDCNLWGLFRHPVAGQWIGDNAALIGDAAHPMLPFLAQGANMALEDAWVLADCLGSLPHAQALPAYQARRRNRVVRVINAANANARNFHLRSPVVRLAAHSVLRVAQGLVPARLIGQFDWLYDYDATQQS